MSWRTCVYRWLFPTRWAVRQLTVHMELIGNHIMSNINALTARVVNMAAKVNKISAESSANIAAYNAVKTEYAAYKAAVEAGEVPNSKPLDDALDVLDGGLTGLDDQLPDLDNPIPTEGASVGVEP